jgi:PAS domain-containing protein
MNALRLLFNSAPKSKIHLLYAGSWLLILLLGYGFIAQQVVSQRIKRINGFAELVMNVSAPVLAEAALGNKTLWVQQALDATASSPYFDTLTITSTKGDVIWQSQIPRHQLSAPHELNNWLQSQLPVVQKPLVHNGQNVGLLQIRFETEVMANEIWTMFWLSLIFVVTLATTGVFLGLVPLSRALAKMSAIGRQANVTLNAIGEGVITCNEHFELISMNPAAQRLLGFSASDKPGLLGKDVRELLPKLFFANEVTSNLGVAWPRL